MNCDGEDLLNIDIDPDFLISLVGKLSLNNIPDFTETLQSLENNPDTLSLETEEEKNYSCSAPLECDVGPVEQLKKSSCCSLNSNNESKDGFLSSIGLLSAPWATDPKNTPLPRDNFLDDATGFWNALASDPDRNKESCRAKEKSADISPKKKTNKKKCIDSYIQENSTCDNAESHWQGLPFLSGASFPHKSVNSLQDVFSQSGMVYDIQLSDIGGSLKLNLNTEGEAATDASNSLGFDSDKVHDSDRNVDLVENSVCSPDSGISTSPCPSAVSPYSPPTDLDLTDDSEEYDRQYEDDLERLLAELIEIENSLRYEEIPQSNANVPVLKDAKNPEDHKEKILNFLKEPIFNDLKSQLSLLKEKDIPIFPELFVENSAQSVSAISPKGFKKISPRSKKHKLGFEFKYAIKNELRHSSIFTKGKHFSSRNKILKQIQDDERVQKQVKLIQRLIVSKKLKRTDSDDRENKKRRIQLTDSCFSSQ